MQPPPDSYLPLKKSRLIAVELRECREAGSGSWLNDTVVISPAAVSLWRSLVLRESDPQTAIWELLLPEEAKRLPAELAQVDAYLDDECFIAPFRARLTGGWAARRCRSRRCCGCCV
jgi:hypothetical protein